MKKLIYRLATGSFLLLWMVVIFWFSAQPALESQEISESVSYRVIEACSQIFDKDMTESTIQLWAKRIDYPIRKMAHMTEYAILAASIELCILGYRKWGRKTLCGAFLFSVGYAVTDEIHQLSVPGRAGRLTDVCIDALGALIGLTIFWFLLKFVQSIAKRRSFH